MSLNGKKEGSAHYLLVFLSTFVFWIWRKITKCPQRHNVEGSTGLLGAEKAFMVCITKEISGFIFSAQIQIFFKVEVGLCQV